MTTAILAPAAVLVLWTLVMLFWMAGTRFPAMKAMRGEAGKTGSVSKARVGGRGQDLEGRIPDKVNWKAHNHTHLHEQPTLFYAVTAILAIAGAATIDVWLAWAYVALRVAHSLWQALVNTIPTRLKLFFASTLVLLVLAVRALLAVV